MTNPEGFRELSARYDPAGRVQEVFANGLNRAFEYKRNRETEVRDTVMGVAQFTQDRDGITVGVRSFAGGGTHIELDDDHRVVELRADSGATAEFRYEDKHLKIARLHAGITTRQLSYGYNPEGKLASIDGVLSDTPSAPPDTLQLEYDPHGALSGWSSADRRRNYEYSQSGDLTQLTLNSRTYTFASDADGQITLSGDAAGKNLNFIYGTDGKLERTTYWDGAAVAYEHDALGTRSFGDWSGQSSVVYTYDRSGNARDILITSADGQTGGHTIDMDAQQRVKSITYRGGGSLTVTYDAAGNPERIVSSAGDDMRYEYDASNRLQRIVSNGSEVLKYDYATTERDLRAQSDHKTMRTLLPVRRASIAFGSLFEIVQTRTQGTPLGAVVFDEELVAFRLVGPTAVVFEDAAVYDGLSRMRLIRSGRDGFADKDRFEQPSNVLFLPPEYVSINCCIPCPSPGWFMCGRCTWRNGEPVVCYCSWPAPPPPPPPPPAGPPVTITYTTFIPLDHVRLPSPHSEHFYEADNQSSYMPGTFAFRVQQTVTVRTGHGISTPSAAQSTLSRLFEANVPTTNLTTAGDCFRKNCSGCGSYSAPFLSTPIVYQGQCMIRTATPKDSSTAQDMATVRADLVGAGHYDANRNFVKVRLQGAPKIGVVPWNWSQPLAPAIDWDVTIELTRNATTGITTYTVTGGHDGFPFHEIRIGGTLAWQRDPIPVGDTPQALYGNDDVVVSAQGSF